MNARLLPQQDIATAKACNLSRVGELCKRVSSSMSYRRDGSQLCSIWPRTRWCKFSTAQILPFFTCSCRCNVKTSGNSSFSVNQDKPAGLSECYLNQQIKLCGVQTTHSNMCMLSAVLVHVVPHAEGQVGDPLHTCTCPPSPLYVVCSAGESILLCSEQRRLS